MRPFVSLTSRSLPIFLVIPRLPRANRNISILVPQNPYTWCLKKRTKIQIRLNDKEDEERQQLSGRPTRHFFSLMSCYY
jgi:hypothetical protein